ARRWTRRPNGGGYIHSFNGAHSLFVDTMRSLRALALGHVLGQPLLEEQDERIDLLDRIVHHARATAQYNVYYGEGRDRFDVRGRVRSTTGSRLTVRRRRSVPRVSCGSRM